MNQEQAKQKIAELVKKYEAVKSSGQDKKYTEEETKKDFILPLFAALGWDVFSKNEVSAEEHIKSSGRVDYGFYINDRTKFYLEAKSFKADLNDENFAKQAIRYSWNKGVTWAILTNFENIKVFNAQAISKYLGDKKYFEMAYSEFLERFEQLWQLSRESFEQDVIDKEAERVGKKILKVSISNLLYKDLNECREILTKAFSIWNKGLGQDLLDEGVQKLLDRLIFIRVAEDRGIESSILRPLLHEWEAGNRKEPFFKSLTSKFRELDAIYNSNLFSQHPFENWEEYDNATKDVLNILYGKPGYYEYDFKIIPADILGTVYENYLGYRLSQSKKNLSISKDAKKRKEHGIYYTPSFIVDYIVKNALKPVLDKCLSIDDLKKVRVLDPACGSGSFLIKALEMISERYKEFHRNDPYVKIQILTENIYGVDLDEQAVEIARLNLLLSSLDGKIKLPSLANNIKNGNSLISGTDEELKKYFGNNFRDKKPFNWKEEFPEVFKRGGFDVVIGNPPYISAIQDSKGDPAVREFYRDKYSLKGAFDIYVAFLIKGVQVSNEHGSYGWIIPNKLMIAEYAESTINFLKENGLYAVIDVSVLKVFGAVGVYPVIILGDKTRKDFHEYEVESAEDLQTKKFKSPTHTTKYKILKDLGIKIASGATGFQAKLLTKYISENLDDKALPFVVSGSIDPYHVSLNDIRYMGHNYGHAYITKGDGIAESKWNFWQKNKIVISGMTKRIEAYYSTKPLALGVGVYAIYDYGGLNPYFLLAVLNSKFLTHYLKKEFKHKHLAGGYLAINKSTLEQLPLIKPNPATEKLLADFARQMVLLVDQLDVSVENSNEWQRLKHEIAKTNQKIDQEVYKLYGLTDEEIKIVESSN